jgi:hypothetical protein
MIAMNKLDLKLQLKEFYSIKAGLIKVVKVPPLKFLLIDGEGYPGISQEYIDAMSTLYPICYKLKFIMKANRKDYTVMPLEGLWWADDMSIFTNPDPNKKNNWKWTAMILQPDFISENLLKEAIEELKAKEKPLPSIKKLRFETFEEGLSAQMLHIGPYSTEGPNIQKLHAHITDVEHGLFDGYKHRHHEIYLSNPQRIKPERMKTIIRQPFSK